MNWFISFFVVITTIWAGSCAAYWLFRSKMPRRYSAYAAGRLDTLYVIFIIATYALILCAAWLIIL